MSRVIFLLEEKSMKELLDRMLPRIFPSLRFLCIPHEGKADLEVWPESHWPGFALREADVFKTYMAWWCM